MTPKEKAIELFDKYYRLFNNFPNYQYVIENLNTIQDEKLYITKQCALIAVDEIIEFMEADDFDSDTCYWANHSNMQYWQEVKQEIENL